MNEKIKSYISLITMILVNILIILGIMKISIGLDKEWLTTIVLSLSSIIGGSLTLIGVKWTLDNQQSEKEKEKIIIASHIYTEIMDLFIGLKLIVKELNGLNFSKNIEEINIIIQELRITSQKLIDVALKVDIRVLLTLKSIVNDCDDVLEFVNLAGSKGLTDQDVISFLKKKMEYNFNLNETEINNSLKKYKRHIGKKTTD